MKKGFTLIELLAVIVILAIIALIATPIILNIISTSKEESDKRSIELYGEAIKNAIANYAMNNPEDDDITLEDIEDKIEYKGSKVECGTIQIHTDGTIYLAECKVDTKEVEYTYGEEIEEEYKQVYKPQYYESFVCFGKIGNTLDSKSTDPHYEWYGHAIGLDSEDGTTVSAAYACFERNGNEYCLKGGDGGAAYETNVNILKKAFKDVIDSCNYESNSYKCNIDSLEIYVDSDGKVKYDGGYCIVDSDGSFESTSMYDPCVAPGY